MDADETTFSTLFEHHRRELQAHCYRMVGRSRPRIVVEVIHCDRPELFDAFGLPMSLPRSRSSSKDEVNAKEAR